MGAEEWTERAKQLRIEGRGDEAVAAGLEATKLAPASANAWWQLGLAQRSAVGPSESRRAFEMTTELAPTFGSAWYYRGLAELDDGDKELAKFSMRRGAEFSDAPQLDLEQLANLCEELKDPDGELWALTRLEEISALSTYRLNRLGILHHNAHHFASALGYYRRCALEGKDPAGWINLGLVFNEPAVNQRLDAVDTWLQGKALYHAHARFEKLLEANTPPLLQRAYAVRSRTLALIGGDQLYKHYLSPFELLDIAGNDADAVAILDDARNIGRAKKRLLQEIELEDGQISWMPGLRAEKSQAIALCEELNSLSLKYMHANIYESKPLLDFLSRGTLEHFTLAPDVEYPKILDVLEDDGEFRDWLSPIFAAQFSLVFAKALERRDLIAIECMLDGRRLVTPKDQERCFEAARRIVDRLLGPLRALKEKAEKSKPSVALVTEVLKGEQLADILVLLPSDFHDLIEETAELVRSISITSYNVHDDADLALAIIGLSDALVARSPAAKHRLDEDRSTLKEKIRAEREDELELVLGGKRLAVTKEGVFHQDRSLPADEVTSMRWGIAVKAEGGSLLHHYRMVLAGTRGPAMDIQWRARPAKEQDDLFNKLIKAAIVYIAPGCIDRLKVQLRNGQPRRVGPTKITADGVVVTIKGWFSDTAWTIHWSRLSLDLQNGMLIVRDRSNAKADVTMSLQETDDAILLYLMHKFSGAAA
jgi:hypothetical protein